MSEPSLRSVEPPSSEGISNSETGDSPAEPDFTMGPLREKFALPVVKQALLWVTLVSFPTSLQAGSPRVAFDLVRPFLAAMSHHPTWLIRIRANG